ncbi:hypothetical protein Taro_010559 [Colocasia esculenta]|uniref:Retrotransposon gag domain-containing protein n=1 Tax=Colocasia esculenta TaxID=4460 RepID=A0A843U7X0_COLES|nr:hypothetical protein [Colocasia esculenta]
MMGRVTAVLSESLESRTKVAKAMQGLELTTCFVTSPGVLKGVGGGKDAAKGHDGEGNDGEVYKIGQQEKHYIAIGDVDGKEGGQCRNDSTSRTPTRDPEVRVATHGSEDPEGLNALAGDPFPLSPFFPSLLSLRRCSASPSSLCVFQARRRVVRGVVASWTLCGVVGGPGMEHPVVCLSTDVTTAVRVATLVEASARSGFAVVMLCPVAIWLVSRCPSPSRWYRNGLGGRDIICIASGVSVDPGAWHLRACLVQWLSPLPGTPVLGILLREYSGLRACSSWQLTWQTLEQRGKRGLDSGAESFAELSCLGRDAEVVEAGRQELDWRAEGVNDVSPSWLLAVEACLVRGGTSVCGFPALWHVHSSGWFCLWALDLVEVYGGRACGETSFSPGCCVVSTGVPRVASALCATPLVSAGVVCVARPRLVVVEWSWTGNPYWALFARLTPLLPSARGSPSWELGVGQVAEAAVAPCVVSSRESECCELLYRVRGCPARFVCVLQWVAVVVVLLAWRVRSLGVFVSWWNGWRWTRWQWSFPYGGRLHASPGAVLLVVVGASGCSVCHVVSLVERCNTCLWLLSAWCWLVVSSGEVLSEFFFVGSGGKPFVVVLVRVSSKTVPCLFLSVVVLPQGLRCAVGLVGAFWQVFPERCLGGSGGGSSQYRPLLFLAEVLPRSALCSTALGAFGGGSPQSCFVLFWLSLLSLYRDELSLLPVGLFVLQSAWALSVKVVCFASRALCDGPGYLCPLRLHIQIRLPRTDRKISGMADRRDWGGGGDDPEESTQHMIERIWESLTDIRARMDQQAPVPPVAVPSGDGETAPVAPVPSRVELPFAAPVPPLPPVLLAEEPVMQVEKFLRLQPPTYSGGPNPDTAEHWVHEIERVFATMRCPAADKVVLAAYQLRDFALEWWRLKMQTTFAGRTEETITWSEFLDVKEEDGEVVSNFSKAEVGLRWRSRSRVLPGSLLLHQDIDAIIVISRDI